MSFAIPAQAEPAVAYLPNNRRLAEQLISANVPLPGGASRVVLRGEDIPFAMNHAARRGERAIGITGDDLLDDWLAGGNALDERVVRTRLPWNDPRALYGKPALCLIARNGARFEAAGARIGVCSRYRNLAQRYLDERFGLDRLAGVTAFSGGTETLVGVGVVDAVIDIVVTGSTIGSLGLQVVDVIYASDLARLEVRP
jgi:ATP phosphoribosyltransferase